MIVTGLRPCCVLATVVRRSSSEVAVDRHAGGGRGEWTVRGAGEECRGAGGGENRGGGTGRGQGAGEFYEKKEK